MTSHPLLGPPEPWAPSQIPPARSGPPYLMTEMIEAEPGLAARLLARLARPGPAFRLAAAVRDAALSLEPIVVTGCGTSEHAAQAVAAILRDALGEAFLPSLGGLIEARGALDAALEPQPSGLCLGISHEGGTAATIRALDAARRAGAATAAITVSARSPIAAPAEIVVATEELDQSWCHTIGYLSPILAATAVAGHLLDREVATPAIVAALAAGLDRAVEAEAMAAALAERAHLLIVAGGVDVPTARELALKIEEGSCLPAVHRDLEMLLHGHLAATDETTGLVLVLTDRRGLGERIGRARDVLEAARRIGIRAAAILTEEASARLPASLTPAGRISLAEPDGLARAAASLLAAAIPIQLLAERLARARGRNPDLIRRDEERYRAAAEAAEASLGPQPDG